MPHIAIKGFHKDNETVREVAERINAATPELWGCQNRSGPGLPDSESSQERDNHLGLLDRIQKKICGADLETQPTRRAGDSLR